jgi:peroxiredoxin
MTHPIASRALAAALFAFASAQLVAQDEPKLLQAGQKAPDFVSATLDGKEVRISDYAGKVVVIDFWATWCGPCIASFPHVQEVAKAHKAHDVVVLAVCTSDSRSKFEEWVQKNGANYPDLVFTCDPNDRSSKTFDQRASQALYHVQGIPTKFVVGKDGVITGAIVGHSDGDVRFEAALARAGVAIDAETTKRGEAQTADAAKRDAEEQKKRAANPPPSFYPQFGSIKHGEDAPDFTLVGKDGAEMKLSSMRGKPVVVGFGWSDTVPVALLEEMQAHYASYGVQCVAAQVLTERAEFDALVAKLGADSKIAVGWDPAGKMPSLNEGEIDNEARQQWGKVAVIRRYYQGNMLPAMPTMMAIGADGKLLGGFGAKTWKEAMGNLLLKSGVKLAADHMPKVVAGPEAFQPPKARAPEAKVEMLQPGVMAPDFAMTMRDGKQVKLSDFRGKVVVLDFWATWCGPCVAAMPHVQEIADHYKDQGVIVLASCTSDERSKFDAWVDSKTQDYPNVLFAFDPLEKSADRASRKLYGVSGIPQQFVIDKDGKVVAEVGGYRKGEVLLDAALAKAGVKVDAATLEQAAKDQAARDAARGDKKAAIPMKPMVPAGGMVPATPMKPVTPGDGSKKQ